MLKPCEALLGCFPSVLHVRSRLKFTAFLSEIALTWDWHWLQILILMCYSTEVAFSGDKPSFDSDADAFWHNSTDPAKTVNAKRSISFFRWEVKILNLLLDVVVSPQMQNPNNFMHDSCENGKLTIPTFHDNDKRQHRRRTLDRWDKIQSPSAALLLPTQKYVM